MKIKLILNSVKNSPFESNGEKIDYFWYKAERVVDGVSFDLGSAKGDLALGVELELNVEKTEGAKPGKFRYKYRPE